MTTPIYLWHVFVGGRSVGFVRATLAYARAIERNGYTSMIDWRTKCSARRFRAYK